MAGKTLKQLPTAPLQKYTAVSITDPAEIAELKVKLKRHRAAERSVRVRGVGRTSNKITVAEVLGFARQLSAEKKLQLIMQLAAHFSLEERLKLVEQLAAKMLRNAQQQTRD